MLTDQFTVHELIELSLGVPEKGAVNFNILREVLLFLATCQEVGEEKIACNVADVSRAQLAVTAMRMEKDEEGWRRSDTTYFTPREKKKSPTEAETDETSAQDEKNRTGDESTQAEKEKASAQDEKPGEGTPHAETDTASAQDEKPGDETKQDETDKTSAQDAKPGDETPQAETDKTSAQDAKKQPSHEPRKAGTDQTKPAKAQSIREIIEQALPPDVKLRHSQDSIQAIEDRKRPPDATMGPSLESLSSLPERSLSLTDKDLFESHPDKVVREMWRSTNINRRMDGAEATLSQLSAMMDRMLDMFYELKEEAHEVLSKAAELQYYEDNMHNIQDEAADIRIRIQEAAEDTKQEVHRLEDSIRTQDMKLEQTDESIRALGDTFQELKENTMTKNDMADMKEVIDEEREELMKDMLKKMREVRDQTASKDEFLDLVTRTEEVEKSKVDREELGKFGEPGFIDEFIDAQGKIKKDLQKTQEDVSSLEDNFRNLTDRIDEQILPGIEADFARAHERMDTMQAKLDTLDADDINDSFVRLEEECDALSKRISDNKKAGEKTQRETRTNTKNLAELKGVVEKMEMSKMDKAKAYELLETKADWETVARKVEQAEFDAVTRDTKETMDTLATTIEINEMSTQESLRRLRRDLSFKMYTEDFVVATEPLRNRILAIMHQVKKVRELAIAASVPDAARSLTVKGIGDGQPDNEDKPSDSSTSMSTTEDEDTGFTDEDIPIPIPPADANRLQEAAQLPVLLATAQPQVGLPLRPLKKGIDNKLEQLFRGQKKTCAGGKHTMTRPGQKGASFMTVTVPAKKKSEILLEGKDGKYYRGAIYKDTNKDLLGNSQDESQL